MSLSVLSVWTVVGSKVDLAVLGSLSTPPLKGAY